MPSVATPEYPVVIVNLTPALPPVPERTPVMVMSAIESWEYWLDIKCVALKEYGMEPEKFDALLPEYQRYLALIMRRKQCLFLILKNRFILKLMLVANCTIELGIVQNQPRNRARFCNSLPTSNYSFSTETAWTPLSVTGVPNLSELGISATRSVCSIKARISASLASASIRVE